MGLWEVEVYLNGHLAKRLQNSDRAGPLLVTELLLPAQAAGRLRAAGDVIAVQYTGPETRACIAVDLREAIDGNED